MSCRPTRMLDGEWRCLQPVEFHHQAMFLDDQCSQAVVVGLRGPFEPLPGDLARMGEVGCWGLPEPEKLFLVGEEVALPAALYALNPQTGTCVASSLNGLNQARAATPLPATDLVGFSVDETVVSARLGAPAWAGSDGSLVFGTQPEGLRDLERDTTVKVYDARAAFRLLPSREPDAVVCNDPACGIRRNRMPQWGRCRRPRRFLEGTGERPHA